MDLYLEEDKEFEEHIMPIIINGKIFYVWILTKEDFKYGDKL